MCKYIVRFSNIAILCVSCVRQLRAPCLSTQPCPKTKWRGLLGSAFCGMALLLIKPGLATIIRASCESSQESRRGPTACRSRDERRDAAGAISLLFTIASAASPCVRAFCALSINTVVQGLSVATRVLDQCPPFVSVGREWSPLMEVRGEVSAPQDFLQRVSVREVWSSHGSLVVNPSGEEPSWESVYARPSSRRVRPIEGNAW